MHLESDKPTAAVEDVAEPTDAEQADAARRNADIDPQEFQQLAIVETDPSEVTQPLLRDQFFIDIQLPDTIAGVDPPQTTTQTIPQDDDHQGNVHQDQPDTNNESTNVDDEDDADYNPVAAEQNNEIY